ncbi:MAG: hypothetical protein HOC95_04015 [Candidatus Diapherotrites archaeon]|nr:hypothetical protein [Candidatus Diapherotrites archaeon]
MVRKAHYLTAAKQLFGTNRSDTHRQMGEAAHAFMTKKQSHSFNSREISRIIVKANDLTNAGQRRTRKPALK